MGVRQAPAGTFEGVIDLRLCPNPETLPIVIAQNHPEIHLLKQRVRSFKFLLELGIVHRVDRMRIDIVAQAQHKVAPFLLAHVVHSLGVPGLLVAAFSHIAEGDEGDRGAVWRTPMHMRQEHFGGNRT